MHVPGEIVHSVEVLELLSVMTGDDRFERAYNESLQGGSVSMFTVLDFYENKGREEGLKEGREQGLEQGHRDTISATLTDFVRVLKGFVSDFDQVYEKVQESESYKGISRDVILDIYNKV
jgi:flagellar biosynthesis/type III secretory pathway protein FliH